MKIPIRFSRFAWKEFLRGPLGTPVVLARNIRPVGRLMPVKRASLDAWSRISALPLSTGAKKAIYRALWVLPFGPGDPATLPRVVKRHREFLRSRAAHA
jgi:hypothetical protein